MNSTTYGVDEYGNEAADVRSGYIGEIKMFGYAGVPKHCLACDGSLLSIAAYPELYAKLGTQHGGDGVTTFALPTAEDVIYAAGNGRAVGVAVADGLPNITGIMRSRPVATGTYPNYTYYPTLLSIDGALQNSPTASDVGRWNFGIAIGANSSSGTTQDIAGYTVTLDASRGNPIYGASQHVQPKGTAFNFCIVFE